MKRLYILGAALIAALVLVAPAVGATDQNAQVSVVSGSDPMPTSEVQYLVGAANWAGSAEAAPAARTTAATKHCYGAVYWKAGVNAVGVTLWKEWNHTGWCGVPFDHVIASSVGGYTTTYTSPAWNVAGRSWTKNVDRNSNNAYWTRGDADFSECFGPLCLGSKTIQTHMHIFAAGGWTGS